MCCRKMEARKLKPTQNGRPAQPPKSCCCWLGSVRKGLYTHTYIHISWLMAGLKYPGNTSTFIWYLNALVFEFYLKSTHHLIWHITFSGGPQLESGLNHI